MIGSVADETVPQGGRYAVVSVVTVPASSIFSVILLLLVDDCCRDSHFSIVADAAAAQPPPETQFTASTTAVGCRSDACRWMINCGGEDLTGTDECRRCRCRCRQLVLRPVAVAVAAGVSGTDDVTSATAPRDGVESEGTQRRLPTVSMLKTGFLLPSNGTYS